MKSLLVVEYDGKHFNVSVRFDPEGSSNGLHCSLMQHIVNAARQAAFAAMDYINNASIAFCPPQSVIDKAEKAKAVKDESAN